MICKTKWGYHYVTYLKYDLLLPSISEVPPKSNDDPFVERALWSEWSALLWMTHSEASRNLNIGRKIGGNCT